MGRDAVRAASEARSRVRLRVEVDDQTALAGLGEAGCEVHRRRRLADAALLVRDCVDARGHPSQASRGGGRGRRRSSGERTLLRDARPARETGRASGPSCGSRAGPPERARARPRSAPRRPPRGSRPAASPTQRTTRPPSRTSGRHHSAAVGGCASAFATATPNRSGSCSSARPHVTARFGISTAQPSRKRHLRRSASSSVTSRPAARPRAGSRACRLPSRRRRPGRPSPRRARPPAARPRRGRPCRRRVPNRRQAGRLEHGREPPVEDGRLHAPGSVGRVAGKTTTNRLGSVPSLAVSTSGSSFSSSWTIRRSTAVIGSSSTRRPVAAACSAARRAVASSVAARRAR